MSHDSVNSRGNLIFSNQNCCDGVLELSRQYNINTFKIIIQVYRLPVYSTVSCHAGQFHTVITFYSHFLITQLQKKTNKKKQCRNNSELSTQAGDLNKKCEPSNIHRLNQFHCSQSTSGGTPFIVCSL